MLKQVRTTLESDGGKDLQHLHFSLFLKNELELLLQLSFHCFIAERPHFYKEHVVYKHCLQAQIFKQGTYKNTRW